MKQSNSSGKTDRSPIHQEIKDCSSALQSYLKKSSENFSKEVSLVRDIKRGLVEYKFTVWDSFESGKEAITFRQALDESDGGPVVIVGESGIGKTAAIKNLFLDCMEQDQRVPVYVDLSGYDAYTRSLWDLIDVTSQEVNEIHECFKKGKLLMLFDGLDKISSRDDARQAIRQIKELVKSPSYAGNEFVLATRRPDYEQISMLSGRIYAMQPLARREIIQISTKVLESAKEALYFYNSLDGRQRALCSVLLYLVMMLSARDREQSEAKSKTEVLTRFVDHRLNSTVNRNLVNTVELVIGNLAFKLKERNATLIAESSAIRLLAPKLVQLKSESKSPLDSTISEVLENALKSGILVYNQSGNLEFSHPVFQDYFSAYYMLNGAGSNELFEDGKEDGHWKKRFFTQIVWRNALIILTGLMENSNDSTELINQMISEADITVSSVGAGAWASDLIETCASCIESSKNSMPQETISRFVNILINTFTSEEPWVGQLGLAILGDIASKELISQLGKGDPRIRRRAIYAMGKMKLKGVSELLHKSLEDKDLHVKYHTVRAIGEIGEQNSLEVLATLLDDPDPVIVGETLSALKRYPRKDVDRFALQPSLKELTEKVIPKLTETLRDRSKKQEERAHAVEELGNLADDTSSKVLNDILENETDEYVKSRVATSVALIGDNSSINPLSKYFSTCDKIAVHRFVWSLGHSGKENAIQFLKQIMETGTEENVKRLLREAIEYLNDHMEYVT